MATSIPVTKSARQALIGELIARQPIRSQAALRQALVAEGIEVTQATLSRDLLELKATKVRDREGHQVYAIPSDGGVRRAEDATVAGLQRWCHELLVSCDRVGSNVILRTPAGAAQLLASAIDRAVLEGVAGTLGGDDTIFMICRSEEAAKRATEYLLGFIDTP
ncbi:MAG: arginine repressor [Actinomycetaceae bacterium]|nr:arginine repressor [Actinomycetaceae bacterium]